MKLSVIVPVYNEAATIATLLKRVQATGLASEILVIDDGSTDGTGEILRKLSRNKEFRLLTHERNLGKGASVLLGFQQARGDVLLVQDADLEYDPRDYPALLKPLREGIADVVYGSRFLGGPRRPILFWNMLANRLLTLVTNILYNNIISDMETGYKVFRADVLKGMKIKARRFNFEPEITARLLKMKVRLYEVPISFNPRDYSQGKKIRSHDFIEALWTLIKYRFVN